MSSINPSLLGNFCDLLSENIASVLKPPSPRKQYHSQVMVLLDEKEKMKTQVHELQQEKGQVENEAQHLLTKFQEKAKEAWLSYDQLVAKSDSDSKTIKDLTEKNKTWMKKLDDHRIELTGIQKKNDALTAENENLKTNLNGIQDDILAKTLAVSL